MSDEQNRPAPRPNQNRKRQTQDAGKFDFNTLLQQLWHGSIPLVQTFWLYYFAAVFAMGVLGNSIPGLGSLFYLLQLVWAGFMVKPIWVAADDYNGPAYWAVLAKIASVLIGVAVVVTILS